jgi:hypothetical protein
MIINSKLKKGYHMNDKFLYHVTSPKAVERIKIEGLKADDEGYIYTITELFKKDIVFAVKVSIADIIAATQTFLPEYVLITIDTKGIKSKLESDNVAELNAIYQVRFRQDIIELKFLSFGSIQKPDIEQIRRHGFFEMTGLFSMGLTFDKIKKMQKKGELPLEITPELEEEYEKHKNK